MRASPRPEAFRLLQVGPTELRILRPLECEVSTRVATRWFRNHWSDVILRLFDDHLTSGAVIHPTGRVVLLSVDLDTPAAVEGR